ncbi:hypothetical protein CFP56_012292 [Quercus suber]|uniref:Uncharacterized protein n=1 Tax=Quercus suber TaxID=58331 RepID=A0AAW0M4Q0_QUESU
MAESTIVEIEQPVGASSNSALIATEGQKKLRSIPPIHKVPANIRKWNEGAYTPSNVSIGPYHCNSNIRREYFSKLNILISECAGRKLGVMDEFDIRHYYRETIDDPNYTRYVGNGYVTDYFLMMSSLAQSIEDMELLRHLKIVQGFDYKTDDALLSIVQDLCRDIESIDMNHDYILTFKKLKKFHNRPRNLMHMWKKPLKRDYFSNPWRTASTIAAIILLVLTFIQTVCSVIQRITTKIKPKLKFKRHILRSH